MEEWFREGDFGARCLAAFERSALPAEGFIDDDYFTDAAEGSDCRPRERQLSAVDGDERRAVARVMGRRTRGLLCDRHARPSSTSSARGRTT